MAVLVGRFPWAEHVDLVQEPEEEVDTLVELVGGEDMDRVVDIGTMALALERLEPRMETKGFIR